MKIAILGGTFDPFITGICILQKLAADAFAIDKVLFILNGSSAHKACPFANGPASSAYDAAGNLNRIRVLR
jgi:nicotinic acid mononucleotide adenylyltransferase